MVSLQRFGDQYRITIPKAIAETKGWEKHDEFEWRENSKGNLELVKQE